MSAAVRQTGRHSRCVASAAAPPPPRRRCRTHEEFAAGHAPQAVHIPFMVQTAEGRAYNDDFLQQVGEGEDKAVGSALSSPVVVLV